MKGSSRGRNPCSPSFLSLSLSSRPLSHNNHHYDHDPIKIQDGAIHLYGAAGLRLCPALIMGGGGVALLECTHIPAPPVGEEDKEGEEGAMAPEGMYLLAVSKAGEVRGKG